MPDVFIQSFTHLKDRPQADQALQVLQRLASLVKPIMRKHGWSLPVLSEFFPDDPHLLGLNMNHGQKILVRLRPPHAPHTFYDEEDVLHTLLHELTHNVHGPHDEKFYKFLSGLEEEYEALRRSGYSGEGFHAKGHRLGVNVSHDLLPHIARQKALEAAEKRRQISVVLSGGGRLGGGTRINKSPRELAAEAAERRAQDEKACASGAVAQHEAEKAAKESVQNDVIDLTGDPDSEPEPEVYIVDDESPSPPSTYSPASSTPTSSGALSPSRGYLSTSATSLDSSASSSTIRLGSGSATPSSSTSIAARATRPTVRRVLHGAGGSQPTIPKPRSVSRPSSRVLPKPTTPPPTRTSSISVGMHKAAIVIPVEANWTCPRCTLVNDTLALQCAACLGLRPGAEKHTPKPKHEQRMPKMSEVDEWTCIVCGEAGMPRDLWTCRFCGGVKAGSA